LKLPTEFLELDELLRQMGVKFQPFVCPEIIENLSGPGISATPDEIIVAPDGTLEYRERKVILYIRNPSLKMSNSRATLPKYHVVDCSTLKEMREAEKYSRYVVTRRTNGEFLLNFGGNLSSDNQQTYRLNICKNCLSRLDLRGVYIPNAFPLADWFNAIDPGYRPPPIDGLHGPRSTSATDLVPNYPPGWRLLSLQCRDRAQWKCEECSINLEKDPIFLHAHHMRGKQHNKPEDLKALCFGCHAGQARHNDMKNLPGYQEFMKKYGHVWKQNNRKS